MDNEQLQKAKQLEKQIQEVKYTIERWQVSKGLHNGYAVLYTGAVEHTPVPPHLFDVMRSLSLVYFQDSLTRLERELSEL